MINAITNYGLLFIKVPFLYLAVFQAENLIRLRVEALFAESLFRFVNFKSELKHVCDSSSLFLTAHKQPFRIL